MKKIISLTCMLCTVLTLCACGTKGKDYSNQTVNGKVTAVDGTSITIQLGELKEVTMGGEMPEMNGQQPPEKPDGKPGEMSGGTPPEMPDNNNGETPPEMPENGGPEMPAERKENPPEMSGGMNMFDGKMYAFTAGEETAAFDLKNASVIVQDHEGSLQDITVDTVITLEIGSDNSVNKVTVVNVGGMGGPGGDMNFGGSNEVVQGSAATTISTDGEYSDTYVSSGDDENALRIDGADVTLKDIVVDKKAGATSNTENGDFYGVNAGLLATNGANVTITGAKVNTSAQNGNGVFSYGKGTVVTISDSQITTTADNSGGIQTTGGATTNAGNLTITTAGNSSAAIRSDRGGGTVNVNGGSYTSNGYNSPAVYSTADITVKDAALTAANSEALVIEGKNSITLHNCTVFGNMSDDKGSCSNENVHNVMIYQSMSGDAEVGTAQFTMNGGKMIGNNGDMFYFTNTSAIMTLNNVEFENHEENNCFMRIVGNSEARGWGKAGSNGADVTFTATDQQLQGDIIIDTISTLNMVMNHNSNFEGSVQVIENTGTAKDHNAVIELDDTSVWTLTSDSIVNTLTIKDDARVIVPAGITLKVNGNSYTDCTLTSDHNF